MRRSRKPSFTLITLSDRRNEVGDTLAHDIGPIYHEKVSEEEVVTLIQTLHHGDGGRNIYTNTINKIMRCTLSTKR